MATQENRGGKNHCLIRSYNNKQKGVFLKQEQRTAANKKRHIRKNEAQGDPYAGISMKCEAHRKTRRGARWVFVERVVPVNGGMYLVVKDWRQIT